MMDMTPEQTIEFTVSHLALSLEDALRRLEAYQQVVTKHARHLLLEVEAVDQNLAASVPDPTYIALHTRAVRAVRDQDVTALSESIADLRGKARLKSRRGMPK